MPVVINYKVCDMGRGCPCIKACPTGAWYWNEKNQRPAVDNSKCNNCGICTKQCPARVISGALDEAGIKKIEEEISNDPRTRDDWKKESFNVGPIDESIVVNSSNFEEEVLKSDDVVIVDFWTPSFSARCRVSTMIYEELLPKRSLKVKFRKIDILKNQDFCKKLGITAIPSLVIFHKGKIIDYIAGKIGLAEKEQLKGRIASALGKIK